MSTMSTPTYENEIIIIILIIITFFIEEKKYYMSPKNRDIQRTDAHEIIEGAVTCSPAPSPLSKIYVKPEGLWLHSTKTPKSSSNTCSRAQES